MNLNQFLQGVAGALCAAMLCGCGGNEGTLPVAKFSNNFDVTATADAFRQTLIQARIPILDSRCYEQDASQLPQDRVQTPSFSTPMLYEFDVPASKAGSAESMGFRRNVAHSSYFAEPVPCTTPAPIEAIETAPR